MIPARIPGGQYLGRGDSVAKSGLHVLVQEIEGLRYLASAWQPTQDELNRLNNGASVYLWIQSATHPAVAVEVGKEIKD